jgi:hypothetical protein
MSLSLFFFLLVLPVAPTETEKWQGIVGLRGVRKRLRNRGEAEAGERGVRKGVERSLEDRLRQI